MTQEQCCLEMFQRVLSEGDQQAKAQFQHQLRECVRCWLQLHPNSKVACHCAQEEYYVAQTFACFWQVIAQDNETAFSTLAPVLQYLQVSLNGVIIDTIRDYVCAKAAVSYASRESWPKVF